MGIVQAKDEDGLLISEDGRARCWWHGNDPLYVTYHDKEWGHPVTDDVRLFEKLCLEGFQAGLSWITILRKRENFRNAFVGFDFKKISKFTEQDVQRLLQDEGIIRHRGKIEATINNAKQMQGVIDTYGSFAAYIWSFEPDGLKRPAVIDYAAMRHLGHSPESEALSKDLKKKGFRFVGPTTVYAMMQAMGMVNDHLEGCCMRETIEKKRAALKRPSI